MTAEVKENPARSQWLWRKGAYLILGGLLAIAAVIGWITVEQVESWLAIAERALPTLGSVALLFAGYKTGPGSDESVTHQDVENAAAAASATSVASNLREKMERISEQIEQIRAERTPTSTPEAPQAGGPGTYPTGG